MIRKFISLLTNREFIAYSFIGLSGVALDFIIFLILIKLGVPAIIASVISVSAGIINNFFLNRHLNFKRKDHTLRRFFTFYLVGLTGVVLSVLFIGVLHDIFGMSSVLAKVISVPFIVVFQFWFNKNASFAADHRAIPWRHIAIFAICVSVVSLFIFNAPQGGFSDEDDNILGAQFIASNEGVIYKDYFSHHMPLTYFIGAPFALLFNQDVVAIKVAFGIVMSIWLLAMSRHLLTKYGLVVFAIFTLGISLTQLLTWSHMLLAESLIAFAVAHALILWLTAGNRSFYKDAAVYAILGSIPVLSALSYAPLSILIYSLLLLQFISYVVKEKRSWLQPFLVAALFVMVPYLLFGLYLYLTKSFGELREQALSFNTLYYSQFTPDAPTSVLDAIASIIQGTFTSLRDSLTFGGSAHPQPLNFLFSASLVLAIVVLTWFKKYIAAIVFTVVLFLAGARAGFASTFSSDGQARAGTVIVFVGILLIALAIYWLLHEKKAQRSALALTGFYITLGTITLFSLSLIGGTARAYLHGAGTLKSSTEKGSDIAVINLLNSPSDYYWTGPLSFGPQTQIDSKNSSIHRFYAPWHAACPQCTQRLIEDIAQTKPNVIALDETTEIWGHPVKVYAKHLVKSFEDRYYKVSDPRLEKYFFKKDNATYINDRLKKAGYEVDSEK